MEGENIGRQRGAPPGDWENSQAHHRWNTERVLKILVFGSTFIVAAALLVLFVIVPAFVVADSLVNSEKFSEETIARAEEKLDEGYDKTIAGTSFVVGLFSIGYAWLSSRKMEKESARQEMILQQIQWRSEQIGTEVAVMNERVKVLYEKRKDLTYTTPSQPKRAHEGNG